MLCNEITPRNTFVLVRLLLPEERTVGRITVPADNQEFCEAEVVAVGGGTIMAAGAISETHDLVVGQRVLVKHKKKMERPTAHGTEYRLFDEGLKLKYVQDSEAKDNTELRLVEQAYVIAILTTP